MFKKKLPFSNTLWMYSSQTQSRFYSVCNFGDFAKKKIIQGFPGDPVVRTWHFHCQGSSSIYGWGTKIP